MAIVYENQTHLGDKRAIFGFQIYIENLLEYRNHLQKAISEIKKLIEHKYRL
jgi:hypothetical protein